jgi:hypothetical protein
METNMTSTPDVPIKFSGSFGEIEAYYFDVSIQNDMIVLLWDKNYRGSKYTPPRTNREDEPSEPITVTFEGKTYKAHNFNLKFEIKSANLEILVLIIHKEDVLE